ncbi:MAG: family 43 glycosylhydrolase, partial [Clostridia bacterium]|nr:family 43 glycosylhydrolase [Clostridia bacterium]
MKKLGILLALLSLVALLAIGTAAATLNYAASFQNPVANGADPFVLKDGDTYYLYATEDSSWGYRVYTSQNLVDWVCHGYCLQKGDVYVEDSSAYYGYWAPEVFKYNGVYYMIYTSQEHLGIATSDSPYGPFTNDTEGGWLFPDFKAI